MMNLHFHQDYLEVDLQVECYLNLEFQKQGELVQGLIDQLDELTDRNGRTWMTPDEMLEFKRQIYANTEYGTQLEQMAARTRNEARQTAARGAKETLEVIDPEIKTLNKQWGDLLELEPELERAVARMSNNQPISIRSPIAAAGGNALGGQAGAITAFLADHMLNSPGMRTRLAKLVRKMQTGEVEGLASINPTLVRVATVLAGRTQEELEEMGLLD